MKTELEKAKSSDERQQNAESSTGVLKEQGVMDAGVKSKKSGGPVERSRRGAESGAISTIKSVGIIGAGQMGNGIAHVVSLAGYDVAMYDLKKEAVDKARSTIERNMMRQVSRGIITDAQMSQALKRIGYASDIGLARRGRSGDRGCDRGRDRQAQDLHRPLSQAEEGRDAGEQYLVDLHHPSLPPVTDRPERFIGMHFMNPVPMMQLVELIRGHRHRGRHLCHRPQLHREPRQEHRGVGGLFRPSSSTASCCR
jgi:hypothetical protein